MGRMGHSGFIEIYSWANHPNDDAPRAQLMAEDLAKQASLIHEAFATIDKDFQDYIKTLAPKTPALQRMSFNIKSDFFNIKSAKYITKSRTKPRVSVQT